MSKKRKIDPNTKITTLEMEIVMMDYLNYRQNLIVPNVHWGIEWLHECDLLLLTKSGYATEIEIKISRADIIKDKEKRHNHDHRLITKLYFAVPIRFREVALEHIPDRAGLFTVEKFYDKHTNRMRYYVKHERSAKRQKDAYKWSPEYHYKLARLGAMRVPGLKKKIASMTCTP